MTSPTQRSLALLRRAGWQVAIAERWNPHARIRQDLFGFADLVALDPEGRGTIAIQTTSAANLAARQTKLLANEIVPIWIGCGNRVILHGWAKRKLRRGGKAVRWQCTTREILAGYPDLYVLAIEQDS